MLRHLNTSNNVKTRFKNQIKMTLSLCAYAQPYRGSLSAFPWNTLNPPVLSVMENENDTRCLASTL